MSFTVHLIETRKGPFRTGGKKSFPNEDEYEFLNGGILRVTRHGKPDTTTYYAPGQWEDVETKDGHAPGGPNNSDVPITDTIH
ncbi:hypothetical protein [Mycolicibacterium wolinskyi]|uniref:hypothetical protein n=1 Tax=Mycolicibacterium wolinskyi TaxID=59750 RepID=UPI003BADBE33